ncbi:hypothetical protein [Streptomyces sp. NBC_01483]|nr:hypothetical protein [Streptomyces sp. NBC_01483]
MSSSLTDATVRRRTRTASDLLRSYGVAQRKEKEAREKKRKIRKKL